MSISKIQICVGWSLLSCYLSNPEKLLQAWNTVRMSCFTSCQKHKCGSCSSVADVSCDPSSCQAAYFPFCQMTPWDGRTTVLWSSPTGRTAPPRTSHPWTCVGFCTATPASGRRSAVWMTWRMEWSVRPSRVWRLCLMLHVDQMIIVDSFQMS